MITKNGTNNQLPTETKLTFKELKVFKHLRNAGITKFTGYSTIYMFQLVYFCFYHKLNHPKSTLLVGHAADLDTFAIVCEERESKKRRQLNVERFKKR